LIFRFRALSKVPQVLSIYNQYLEILIEYADRLGIIKYLQTGHRYQVASVNLKIKQFGYTFDWWSCNTQIYPLEIFKLQR
jgi:hypothetical protein